MEFDASQCQDYYFKRLTSRHEQQYDYLWCNIDSIMHKHVDFYELFFMAGGSAIHYYEGQQQELHKNWMFFFKPGEYHRLYTKPFKSFHFSFFATPDFFQRFFEENPIFQDALQGRRYLSCEMTDLEFDYINMLANSLTHQSNEYRSVSLLLYNALALLVRGDEAGLEVKENQYVTDLVAKLNNYTYLTCKIQEIYKNYPIARCTLIQEFKNYTGMTIVQYQRKQKMSYAAQLLSNSGYTVSEVAEALKFESLSHFLRIFKEYYGMTPKEYRSTHMR